jgi:primosomal protein DnaI
LEGGKIMEKIKLPAADLEQVDKFVASVQELFPKHNVNINNVNDFALMYEERRHCARCKGLEYCKNNEIGYCLSVNDLDEFSIEECKYQRGERQKRNSLIKTLYLPEGILDAKLESFDTNSESRKIIYKHITEYGLKKDNSTFDHGLYLYGTFAIGKTYALAVIANELSKRNVPSLLIYFPDLVLDLKGAIGTNRFEELINMLKDIEVLMLDDLGSENMTPWLRDEILGPVLNYRALEHKPVFVSSNLSIAEIKTHIMIDKFKSSEIKAERILERLKSVSITISMDDSQKYKR